MQPLEYLPQVKPMQLQGSGVDKYIIKVGSDKGESSVNPVYQSLESWAPHKAQMACE